MVCFEVSDTKSNVSAKGYIFNSSWIIKILSTISFKEITLVINLRCNDIFPSL